MRRLLDAREKDSAGRSPAGDGDGHRSGGGSAFPTFLSLSLPHKNSAT
jgi:hypothetical protein